MKRGQIPGCWKVLSPTRKETSSEARKGRARFQQHRDASCHQVSFSPCKARRRRKFKLLWQKHYIVSFLVGLRTYQHPCKEQKYFITDYLRGVKGEKKMKNLHWNEACPSNLTPSQIKFTNTPGRICPPTVISQVTPTVGLIDRAEQPQNFAYSTVTKSFM